MTPECGSCADARRIAEVRNQSLGRALPDDPTGDGLCRVDGYLMLNPLR